MIILTKGVSGSGKSTWAKDEIKFGRFHGIRVCRDDLRFMLGFGWKFNKENETYVKELRNKIIDDAILAGKNVIVDELNLSGNTERYLRQKYPSQQIVIEDFTYVHPNTCIERDAKREHSVGKKVILQQWRQFIEPEYKPIEISDLPPAIIVDADGTLCLFGKKNPYNRDFENDAVNDRIKLILDSFPTVHILLVSGRSDEFFPQTCEFLEKQRIDVDQIFMRKEGDDRKDVEVKKEIYERNIKGKYNVLFVFDDRRAVKNYWVSQGLYVFDCNQHSVEF